MESLWENKALLYALGGTGSFIMVLALGWVPELDQQFGIVDFPPEVCSNKIITNIIIQLTSMNQKCFIRLK